MENKNKRGHHEGNITTMKDGRIQGRMMIGYDPVTAKPIRKAVYGKSQKEVRDKLKDVRAQLDTGKVTATRKKVTFDECLDQWLENDIKPRLRITTLDNYTAIVNNHIRPMLGGKLLHKLKREDFERLLRQKSEGSADGEGKKSSSTVGLIYLICKQALDYARDHGFVSHNLIEGIALPRKVSKEKNPFNEDEAKLFLRTIRQDRLFAAFYLLLVSGIRRGELLALRWSDVDLDGKRFSIYRSLVKSNSQGPVMAEPKTKSSRRMIPLKAEAVEVLGQHKGQQDSEKEILGAIYQDADLIFCREDGSVIHPDTLTHKMYRLVKESGLERRCVHDLRHTFATMMLSKDMHPKIAQEILGHSKVSTTLDIYSHVMPGIKEKAMERLGAMLDGPEKIVVITDGE